MLTIAFNHNELASDENKVANGGTAQFQGKSNLGGHRLEIGTMTSFYYKDQNVDNPSEGYITKALICTRKQNLEPWWWRWW